jgi:Cof subfamily protein (haloacid dehalogenase superfamily)
MMMPPKLLAFDLDGTLLTSEKLLSPANRDALVDMAANGAVVALASGRLGASMARYVNEIPVDIALLTLNGAAVYMGKAQGSRLIHSAPLASAYADELIRRSLGRNYAVNYYIDDRLYTVRTRLTSRWMDLYYSQTATACETIGSFQRFIGRSPSKIIFVGDSAELDREEKAYRREWGKELYIVRTWDYYLEFLNPQANKGTGIAALADAYGISFADVIAFGDASNDVPMFEKAGTGIAMKNANEDAQKAATYVSAWSNDEDGVAREWERLKNTWFAAARTL